METTVGTDVQVLLGDKPSTRWNSHIQMILTPEHFDEINSRFDMFPEGSKLFLLFYPLTARKADRELLAPHFHTMYAKAKLEGGWIGAMAQILQDACPQDQREPALRCPDDIRFQHAINEILKHAPSCGGLISADKAYLSHKLVQLDGLSPPLSSTETANGKLVPPPSKHFVQSPDFEFTFPSPLTEEVRKPEAVAKPQPKHRPAITRVVHRDDAPVRAEPEKPQMMIIDDADSLPGFKPRPVKRKQPEATPSKPTTNNPQVPAPLRKPPSPKHQPTPQTTQQPTTQQPRHTGPPLSLLGSPPIRPAPPSQQPEQLQAAPKPSTSRPTSRIFAKVNQLTAQNRALIEKFLTGDTEGKKLKHSTPISTAPPPNTQLRNGVLRILLHQEEEIRPTKRTTKQDKVLATLSDSDSSSSSSMDEFQSLRVLLVALDYKNKRWQLISGLHTTAQP